jgi:hypothetical protein
MSQYKEELLDISKMLLDPNNFRFQNAPDFVFADRKRFAEPSVQARTFERLKAESLLPLKQSILKNGFLPFERLVVSPYEYEQGTFVVVEGNRRLAALRWIANDIEAGALVSDEVEKSLHSVPVVIVPDDSTNPGLREALMGVRHVSGIREWGGYQRAQLVGVLREKYNLDSGEVAQRLGMSVQEVNRRYRALQALKQMMNSENFSDVARPEMYSIFHEAVSLPAVREWMSWDDSKGEFQNLENLERFYELITEPPTSGGEATEAKITSYSQVRDLRAILSNTEATKVLLDPSRSFTEALAITKRQEIVNSWKSEVAEAIEAIQGIGSFELKRLAFDDVQLLETLRETVAEVLEDAEKLKSVADGR